MKKILVMAFAVMMLVLVGASAQASLWVPTESGSVDIGYLMLPPTTTGAFAIFDDGSSLGSTSDPHLLLSSSGDTISFASASNGSDWNLTSDETSNHLTLSGSNTFQLAWQPVSGGDWYADTGFSKNSFGHYIVSWNIYNNAAVSLYQSDAVPSVVPIPPSAIMLFSGILGLFGVRRMRRDG